MTKGTTVGIDGLRDIRDRKPKKQRRSNLLKILNQYDFNQLAQKEKDKKMKNKFLVMYHLQQGKTQQETANLVKISRDCVLEWTKRFKEEGLDGLSDRYHRGLRAGIVIVIQMKICQKTGMIMIDANIIITN